MAEKIFRVNLFLMVAASLALAGMPSIALGANPYVPNSTPQTPAGSGRGFNTTTLFPRHDLGATLTTSMGDALTDDILIQTVTIGSGDITGVQLFGQDIIGGDYIAHESDVLAVDPMVPPDGASFTLHIHSADVDLWKLDTHRPMKKSKHVEFVGTFNWEHNLRTGPVTKTRDVQSRAQAPGRHASGKDRSERRRDPQNRYSLATPQSCPKWWDRLTTA